MKNRVLVLGDFMLDQYQIGTVNRISPEAPVPVVKWSEEKNVLGGAANVVANIKALGGSAIPVGCIGDDNEGHVILELLHNINVDTTYMSVKKGRGTISKIRIMAGKQQVVRLDKNDTVKLSAEEEKEVINSIISLIDKVDIVVISDYGKGTCKSSICRKIIEEAHNCSKRIIVDPKGTDWDKYTGADLITPNVKELSLYLNRQLKNDDDSIKFASIDFNRKTNITNLLVTRSEKGMSLIQENNRIKTFPSLAREVYDVSGAGDTVVATIATFWNDTSKLIRSIQLANTAAGISVEKVGTSIVTSDELVKKLRFSKISNKDNKYVSQTELLERITQWRNDGETIAFTNGCFDILHRGHISLIKEAGTTADRLIVGINSDNSVKRLKGDLRPVNTVEDRAYILSELEDVDAVVVFDEDTPYELIKMIKPDVLIKGADYSIDQVVGREFSKNVHLVKLEKGYSTTNTIRKMKNNGK